MADFDSNLISMTREEYKDLLHELAEQRKENAMWREYADFVFRYIDVEVGPVAEGGTLPERVSAAIMKLRKEIVELRAILDTTEQEV